MSNHIEARKGEIAKTVIMPGDPLRAKYMAEKYLDSLKLVNTTRGMLAFSGYYKNKFVTIMASGMGMPSMGIYSYELFKDYDVDNIIRVGSVGAYDMNLNTHDVILTTEAFTDSSFARVQNNTLANINYSSSGLNNKLKEVGNNLGIKLHEGRIYSSDVFYSDYINHKEMRDVNKCLGTEMESFALFHNASLFNKRAACLLTVSNHFFKDQDLSKEEREKAFDDMFLIALGIL